MHDTVIAEKKLLAIPTRSSYNNQRRRCAAHLAGVMELVDVVDSKSTAGDSVPVRVRPPAPKNEEESFALLLVLHSERLWSSFI